MSCNAEAEEYGKILQLVYLAKCRGIELKRQALNMSPSEVRALVQKVIHQSYQERLLSSAIEKFENETREIIDLTGEAPMSHGELSPEDFSLQAASELEFDLKFFPTTASSDPGKEFYSYYER